MIRPRPTPDAILAAVCKALGLHPYDLWGRGRMPRVVQARMVAVAVARRETYLSFPEIARLVLKRGNHSTAVTCLKRYRANPDQLVGNEPMRSVVERVAHAARWPAVRVEPPGVAVDGPGSVRNGLAGSGSIPARGGPGAS